MSNMILILQRKTNLWPAKAVNCKITWAFSNSDIVRNNSER